MEFISSYILFLAKIITIVIVAATTICILIILNFKHRKQNRKGELKITDLSKVYRERQIVMRQVQMSKAEYKVWLKNHKKQSKLEAKQSKLNVQSKGKGQKTKLKKPCLFVINFKGSINAYEVNSLREEITSILSIADKDKQDEVLLRLEAHGGVVHGYGLAAAQLNRLKEKGIRLTVAVDKIATSGGYMMACVADYIIAAPFAIIGSIGVVAQIPNLYRLLKKKDIDIELHTAGEYKRTLTILGENTEHGRKKFLKDLNETHQLFKDFVNQNRSLLDINDIATGEHWYGIKAKDKGLIDDIGVSDDIIIKKMNTSEVIEVSYIPPTRRFIDRLFISIITNIDSLLLRLGLGTLESSLGLTNQSEEKTI